MSTFIALRKRSEESQTHQEARLAVSQVDLTQSAVWLQDIGLSPAVPTTSEPKSEPIRDTFKTLPYINAHVVETRSRRKEAKALEMLGPDYYIIPDIPLSLPKPVIQRHFLRRPSRESYWPEVTGIQQAHQVGNRGQGVLVGVFDTGVDAGHIELRDKDIQYRYVPLNPSESRIRPVFGFDVDGHGTHVSGIIAGKNVGIAPDVDLMVASVIESETLQTSLRRLVVALNWMVSQFQLEENESKPAIVNMSLGFRPEWLRGPEEEAAIRGMRQILRTLLDDFDVLPIVAIGNDGPNVMRAPGYFPETLSVGAVDETLTPAHFSGGGLSPLNDHPEPNLVGLGVDVLSSLERTIEGRSTYVEMSGTSMATPYVTGIAALCASNNQDLQGDALRQHLLETALPLDFDETRTGAGLARYVSS